MRAVEKRLRERIKLMEKDLEEIRVDRQHFRDQFIRRFKFWIECLGEGRSPNVSSVIESDAKFLHKVKQWYW